MKSVVVLGGTGFIGGHVIEALENYGLLATSFDRHYPRYLLKKPISGAFLGDINDREAVSDVISKHDGAINLAGILGTSETVNNPFPSVDTNVKGALNFIQACREHKKPGVQITVGNHFMNNSYAITKTTSERFCLMYNKEHGTKIAVVRGLNAYGPGQKHKPIRKIIPNFVTRALRGEPIVVYGSGKQIMDMIWVKDLADVLVRALIRKHNVYNKIISAGTGRRTSVKFVAETVRKYVGGKSRVKYVEMRAGEPKNAVVLGDPKTLRPLYSNKDPKLMRFEKGIQETIDWYRDNYPWQHD